MRRLRLVLAAAVVLPSGCAAVTAKAGTDTNRFTTREQVRAEFGRPDQVEEADGAPFDQYHTRRKIADPSRSRSLGMGWAMSFGLSELIAFPRELALVGRRLWNGQNLRFEYDAAGRVARVLLNGELTECSIRRQD